MTFPDFLGIGAQKAGTSWLHHNLGRQERVWVPPIKELHYFGGGRRDSLLSRLSSARPSYRRAMRMVVSAFVHPPSRGRRDAFAWAVRYVAPPRSMARYASLFPDDPSLVRGELSPNYALLSVAEIERIVTCNPNLRVIYILRNPIERAWSGIFMKIEKGRLHVDFSTSEASVLEALARASVLRHCDYVANLERWKRYVLPDHVYVGFFDDLVSDPAGFLAEVCRFLGIRPDEIRIPRDVATPRNVREHGGIPSDVLPVLARAVAPYARAQHDYFRNEHTMAWLRHAESALVS